MNMYDETIMSGRLMKINHWIDTDRADIELPVEKKLDLMLHDLRDRSFNQFDSFNQTIIRIFLSNRCLDILKTKETKKDIICNTDILRKINGSRRSYLATTWRTMAVATTTNVISDPLHHLAVVNAIDTMDEKVNNNDYSSLKKSDNVNSNNQEDLLRTKVYGKQEYTNAITASRDTNVSPAEAYDVIRQQIPTYQQYISSNINNNNMNHQHRPIRIADIGAGAGLSTTILYNEKGYHNIDAIDWSRIAWDNNIIEPIPQTVQFYEDDDITFFQNNNNIDQKYDIIVYNFAINYDKAYNIALQYLTNDNSYNSILLAPCNDKRDYWYKQTYYVLKKGNIIYKSLSEIDAWSIQFQPDVTSSTCTGIWCGGFNGFQQKMNLNN